MDDTIVISDEDEETDEPLRSRLLTENLCYDIIDLTSYRCALGNLPQLDGSVIDLTANDGLRLSPVSYFKDELSDSYISEDMSLTSNGSSGACSDSEGTSNVSWKSDSDANSIENYVLQRSFSTSRNDQCLTDEATRKDQCLKNEVTRKDKCHTYKADFKEHSDTVLPLQEWSLSNPTCGESSSDYATGFPNVSGQPLSDAGSKFSRCTAEESGTQSSKINRALLYKLRYFKKQPVSYFFHTLEPLKKGGPLKPIPQSRMSIVNNTREESIHHGTLQFLSEFVTAEHFPPKDIIMHVIKTLLLGAEEQAIKREAYMILMKVQKLHPATMNSVAWDWSLLSEVMERKENYNCHLFLQYVVQTLDDDFQIHLQRRSFQKSLCKTVLSCDKANIKNVIAWLIDAVENACDIAVNKELDVRSECEQRVVFLLQRMLSLAVEVDNLPVTNANRIADLLFPRVIVLKTRRQRELFFSSLENHLLQAKILELIFLNSCPLESLPPRDLPLSLCKILHFIANSTLLLENQGAEWQRWDEILHHICLLFLSLEKINKERLRTPVTDRADEIQLRPQAQNEDVTEADVEQCLSDFWRRIALRSDVPADLQNRCLMLKSLLFTAVKRQIP